MTRVLPLALLLGCATAGPPALARITLRCSDPQAEVTVDGAPAGRAADYAGKPGRLLLRPGRHRIELRGADGAVAVRETEVEAGDDLALSVQLPGRTP